MKPQNLETLVGILDECVRRIDAAGLIETAHLLRMAKLDLVARANGISEEELEIFSYAVQAGMQRRDEQAALFLTLPGKESAPLRS